MKKQIAVIGLGRFGISLASSLSRSGHEVLALDVDERKVQNASTQVTHAVHADATDEAVLEELGIRNFDVAVIAIGSDIQSSVSATMLVKRLGIPYIVAKANNSLHGDILSRIGADKVVYPESEAGNRVAHQIRMGNVADYLPVTSDYGVTRVEVDQGFAGQTLDELGFGPKARESIAVLLIQRGNEIIVMPAMDEMVKPGDTLILSGRDDSLESFLAKTSYARTR